MYDTFELIAIAVRNGYTGPDNRLAEIGFGLAHGTPLACLYAHDPMIFTHDFIAELKTAVEENDSANGAVQPWDDGAQQVIDICDDNVDFDDDIVPPVFPTFSGEEQRYILATLNKFLASRIAF